MSPAEGQGYGPKECGSCRLWRPILEDERGPVGPCRLGVRTGDFPGTAPTCERYLSRDEAVPSAPPPEPTRTRARRPAAPIVRRADEPSGLSEGHKAAAVPPALPDLPEDLIAMTREEFAKAIREALEGESAPVKLSPRWEGGTVVLKPGDASTQPKEISLDSLFHKVIMIRDRLRVLEQKINGNEKLSDTEKVEMQQYLTRCYGSLTTFNLLFRDEREKFVGEKT